MLPAPTRPALLGLATSPQLGVTSSSAKPRASPHAATSQHSRRRRRGRSPNLSARRMSRCSRSRCGGQRWPAAAAGGQRHSAPSRRHCRPRRVQPRRTSGAAGSSQCCVGWPGGGERTQAEVWASRPRARAWHTKIICRTRRACRNCDDCSHRVRRGAAAAATDEQNRRQTSIQIPRQPKCFSSAHVLLPCVPSCAPAFRAAMATGGRRIYPIVGLKFSGTKHATRSTHRDDAR